MNTRQNSYRSPEFSLEEPVAESLDRREWVRFPSNLEALCWETLEEGGEPWCAFVRDISAGGIGLMSRQQMLIGGQFNLKIHSNHVGLTGVLEAEVTSVKPNGPDSWIVGCRFTTPLGEYERRTLL